MFDLGMDEIVVVFVIALLVYGPKDLPELGRKAGKYIAMFKRMVNDVKRQMDAELYDYTKPIKTEIEKINMESLEAARRHQPDITQTNPATPEKPVPEMQADQKPATGPEAAAPETPRDGTPINGK
ncbi:Sec-independent protein translocase protein TatB [Candidatus Magnetominusculus dajiuhuensis]|uniref:Sec-independent protein translocase protein TatB n=1 Tax=Candidatus Magnetominusculus dajiuhuensis TaxID=3137712 RepID=UPI003B4302AE